MKTRQFESLNAAIDYLKSQGDLKFWGRIGHDADICLYGIKVKGYKYTVYLYYSKGLLEIKDSNGPTDWLYN